MALRIPCPRRHISPGLFLRQYWPGGQFIIPSIDVFLVRGAVIARTHAGIDTQSDFVACDGLTALQLGLMPPFGRQIPFSGAAGTQAGMLSFPADGMVGLFVTDYTEYCYLPASPVGFHAPPAPGQPRQRSVLGMTGFLQHFLFLLDPNPAAPFFELDPREGFPGRTGMLPKTGPLHDFIRDLYSP